jgi:major type 1 subunit fimbrin (pilin)
MKKILTSLFALGCVTMAATAAHAIDGQVNFQGYLVDTTCTVKVNGGTNVGTVELPTLPVASFTTVGDTAGKTPFTVDLVNCTKGTDPNPVTKVAVAFEVGTTVDSDGRLLNGLAGSGGSNAGLQLLDGTDYTPILVGITSPRSEDIPSDGGNVSFPFAVEYYAKTVPVTAGEVTSFVMFSLAYN